MQVVDQGAGLPLRVIEPRRGWSAVGWRELWDYRDLFGFLVWRDVKVRYKQTVLGVLWAVLQPLAAMVAFTILFGRWARMPSDGHPYPLFAFAGLLPWTFFSNAVAASAVSLVGHTHLVSKVYFPRLLISLSTTATGLVDLVVSLAMMIGLLAWYGVTPGGQVLLLPVALAITLLSAVGVGSALAALCAVYRDVRFVVPVLLQLWMFASPVIYPVSLVPAEWRWAVYLNPLAGAIELFRGALLGTPVTPAAVTTSLAVAAAVGWAGAAGFRRIEARVADLL